MAARSRQHPGARPSAFAPSVAFLARVWRHALIIPLRWAAGHALFEIGTTEAHVALQAALCDSEEHGHLPNVPELLRQDRRWVMAAVRLRRSRDLGTHARLEPF